MKAAVLNAIGSPLSLEAAPAPVLGTGEVIVDVAATRVLSYAREVFSGERPYNLALPAIPGAGGIGRVSAFGPDATHLAIGDWVYCDPTVRSRDEPRAPDIVLQGLTAAGEGGARLQQHFRHGSFAEQMRIPTENAVRIGPIEAAAAPAWCALGTLLVPYGGFLAIGLQGGETVVVSGATGNFGAAAVAVALAMGAACVIATGRSEAALDELARRYGPRVRTVAMQGDEAADRARILAAAPDLIDAVLDILPPAASPAQARTAILAVRPNGRVALMGGIGMAGGPGLELSYSWLMRNNVTVRGQWMYPPHAAIQMAAMIRAGLVDLAHYDVTAFSLDEANAAVAHAAEHAGPFNMTVIRL